ncbi:MAG TPA: hypothetical protein VF483_02430 [Gemmatimonadaceae bacterium]
MLSTTLLLQVYSVDSRGRKRSAGSTVAGRPVELPHDASCVIEPRQILVGKDWDAIIALLRDFRIDGLIVEGQMLDAALERIARIEHLTYLGVQGSPFVTDAGILHLRHLQRLEHLDLSGTGVTDRGLKVLGTLPRLRTFRCAHSPRTDAGFANLRHCHELTRVDVMGTPSGDGTIAALAGKPVAHLKTGELVTDDGLSYLSDLPAFQKWRGEAPDVAGWMSFEAEPTSLLVRGTLTDTGLTELAGLDGLFALNLDDARLSVTTNGLRGLVDLPHLGWLAVDATNEAMPVIASMPHLRFLACQDTAVGDAGFTALSQSRSLQYLWGRRCHNLGSKGFASLANIPTLRGLSVSCKNVADSALGSLASFPALREFMPMDVPDAGFQHIGKCVNLEALICMYCKDTTDKSTEHIAGLRRLRVYSAWTTQITDHSMEVLSGVDSLGEVVLHYTVGVTDDGLRHLAKLPQLEAITVDGLSRITDAGLASFAPNVRVNILTQ